MRDERQISDMRDDAVDFTNQCQSSAEHIRAIAIRDALAWVLEDEEELEF